MKYEFVDYDVVHHVALDDWRSEAIFDFAMENSISEEWQYYVDAPEFQVGVNAFCKVALLDEQPIVVLIALGGPLDDLQNWPVMINPIIVNPALVGQGHGSAVICEFCAMNNWMQALIFNDNTAAIAAFAKAGFTRVSEHPDGDCATYERKAP